MSMRDLIPWRRQENPVPALFRDEERSPYVQLRREMDRLFEDFFRAPLVGGIGLSSNVQSWPYLEVKETDDQVIVTAELPGLTEKDVDVTVDDGVLTLRGEKKSEHQDKDRGWSERYYGRFERSIVLPDGADEENCQGVLRDGVLTVRMPKSQRTTRGRRIPLGDGATQH
ncbi:hsp20/alpha crystallin family protein [Sphingomonas sp. S17]|jgi:HSP20 family protein|uniref:DNA, contig: SP643 n=2 Tax=Sphingomonas TaxID=13687 RepID=A0A0C9N530_SPHPI|nr:MULTISPECIES: Hsp20/alpha crystallin family protein [Sphingomonas]EGI53612.1 hsp20/alpha crystallin family protein [Sphingomonas sp. S17]QPS14860.1 Hsp20/alpha crystallin family protein [Sphingomonas paucimobilis]GAN14649.1 putative small heat shock protein [Sphingomonas paucimobilis NBRC 13935]SUK04140.1 Spore protein SP21 [Sphingomonas paucimobilis]